jgi:hypothetical protein
MCHSKGLATTLVTAALALSPLLCWTGNALAQAAGSGDSESNTEKDASRSDFACRMANQISTWLSQDARVGVKWKCSWSDA